MCTAPIRSTYGSAWPGLTKRTTAVCRASGLPALSRSTRINGESAAGALATAGFDCCLAGRLAIDLLAIELLAADSLAAGLLAASGMTRTDSDQRPQSISQPT